MFFLARVTKIGKQSTTVRKYRESYYTFYSLVSLHIRILILELGFWHVYEFCLLLPACYVAIETCLVDGAIVTVRAHVPLPLVHDLMCSVLLCNVQIID